MSLKRLLKSIAWKLLPHAGLELETPTGLRLRTRDKGEWASLSEIFVNRVYDEFFAELRDVRSWVDLGCNVGFFSLALENHLRAQGTPPDSTRALLVDANEECVRLCRDTLQVNGLTHWETRHAVLGPANEVVTFHQFRHSVHSGIFTRQRGEKVRRYATTLLANLLGNYPVPHDVIKIDIEGAEKYLLSQEGDLLQRFRFGICEWHAPEMTGAGLQQFCSASGFEVFLLRSQPVDYDLRRGHSVDSRVGMMAWRNPRG